MFSQTKRAIGIAVVTQVSINDVPEANLGERQRSLNREPGDEMINRWSKSTVKRPARYLAVLTLGLGIGIPSGFAHSGAFTDVPDEAPFHDEVNAIRDAGITSGCNLEGTLYCPSQSLRRDAMAAFMKRGSGSTDLESATGSLPVHGGVTLLGVVSVTVPGQDSDAQPTQFIKIDAQVEIGVVGTACDCDVVLFLTDMLPDFPDDEDDDPEITQVSDGSLFRFNLSSVTTQTMTESWVFEAFPGDRHFGFFAVVEGDDRETTAGMNSDFVQMITTTQPFGTIPDGPGGRVRGRASTAGFPDG